MTVKTRSIIQSVAVIFFLIIGLVSVLTIIKNAPESASSPNVTTTTITCTIEAKTKNVAGAQKTRGSVIKTSCPEKLIIARSKQFKSNVVEIHSKLEVGQTYTLEVAPLNANGVMNIIRVSK